MFCPFYGNDKFIKICRRFTPGRTRLKTGKNIALTAAAILLLVSCAHKPAPGPTREEGLNKRNMGEAYILHGNFTSALVELLESEKINPKDAITHNYLGIVYKNKEMPEKAISHFKKAIELNPGYSQAKNNLGTAYLDMGDWDAAITVFKEVTEDMLYMTPQFPLANLGWAYYNKKEYKIAEAYFKKALEKQSNMVIALNGLGQTYMAGGRYTDAINAYKKALQYDSRVPLLRSNLANAFESNLQFKEAVEQYRKIIEISPDSDFARDADIAIRRLAGSSK